MQERDQWVRALEAGVERGSIERAELKLASAALTIGRVSAPPSLAPTPRQASGPLAPVTASSETRVAPNKADYGSDPTTSRSQPSQDAFRGFEVHSIPAVERQAGPLYRRWEHVFMYRLKGVTVFGQRHVADLLHLNPETGHALYYLAQRLVLQRKLRGAQVALLDTTDDKFSVRYAEDDAPCVHEVDPKLRFEVTNLIEVLASRHATRWAPTELCLDAR